MTTTTTTEPMSASQASLYQRLRGHLAALKLTAAAEHLPAVLDQAAAEGLSLTAALERLLAIEVEATETRRLAGRLRFASLPSPATIEDFDFDAAPALDKALVTEFATCRYLQTAINILLMGPPGVGKTHCETRFHALTPWAPAGDGRVLPPGADRDPTPRMAVREAISGMSLPRRAGRPVATRSTALPQSPRWSLPESVPVTTTDPKDSLAGEDSSRLGVGYVVAVAGTGLAHRTADLIRSLADACRASSQSCRHR